MISKTMRIAIELAKEHGGKLTRYPGGFWGGPDWNGERHVGTTTIEALVKRGMMTYTNYQTGRDRRPFPIEATLVQK